MQMLSRIRTNYALDTVTIGDKEYYSIALSLMIDTPLTILFLSEEERNTWCAQISAITKTESIWCRYQNIVDC